MDDWTLNGEAALVTGAAAGIGRACAAAFLEKGAFVAGLDINPKIAGLFEQKEFLGIACDLSDDAAAAAAVHHAAETFGRLDMLVLNAGIFPSGCRIEALSLAEWDRVMRINLDSNLVILREAYPFLKKSPGGGRVVINGSRNAIAPGPGAAAYSTSKAALTQLGRVAALEWAGDGIRVNMIHAHGVFDTDLWTEEVLNARAKHYGMTVEQYKTNNLLKVEITSRDMANMAVAMCGPLFAKITGAQIPMDGGNDRVI